MSALKFIAHAQLTSAQTTIQFTSIPQTYDDLIIFVSARSGTTQEHLLIGFNGSTSNFAGRYLVGSTNSENGSYGRYLGNNMPSGAPATNFSNGFIYIPNYKISASKLVTSDLSGYRQDRSSYVESMTGHIWSDNSAITSIELTNEATTNLVAGTSATLYGILKGSSGGVTVS